MHAGEEYAGGDVSLKQLVEKYGPLPPTWWSTSRSDGSGIGLFRVPFGTTLLTDPATGIDMIQCFHRYVVCAPSRSIRRGARIGGSTSRPTRRSTFLRTRPSFPSCRGRGSRGSGR